jgi:hypothetical protein
MSAARASVSRRGRAITRPIVTRKMTMANGAADVRLEIAPYLSGVGPGSTQSTL